MLGVPGCVGMLERVGAVEQRRAAQPTADGAGLIDGLRRDRRVLLAHYTTGKLQLAPHTLHRTGH
jgi:hypothetical protein